MRIVRGSVLHMGAALLLAAVIFSPAHAMGRRDDNYQDSPAYAPERVERGSPANPTAAYAPPKFDDYVPSNPAPASAAPPVATKAVPKTQSWTVQDGTIRPTPTPPSASATTPTTTPPPSPAVAPPPQDNSEPALPDLSNDGTPGTPTDGLSKPGSPDMHPAAH